MATTLSGTGDSERPRERLWALGPGALTATELVAILLGTGRGGTSALNLAATLVGEGEGVLRRLAARPPAELLRSSGVGPAKAARLLAAFELAGRLSREARPRPARIARPEDVVRLVAPRMRDLQVEEFRLLALDSQSRVCREVTKIGQRYTFSTSSDGESFEDWGSCDWARAPAWLGLYAKNGGSNVPEIDASFDFFEVWTIESTSP